MLKSNKQRMYIKRKYQNQLALILSLFAMSIGVSLLMWILWDVIRLGFSGLSMAVFTEMTPPPMGSGGGLANAIVGSVLMVLSAIAIASPIGILVGIYLSEYGKSNWFSNIARFMNDILLSAPSIVIGLFIYALLVKPFQGFSGWAGVAALSLIVIPVVVRTTENMLSLVPDSLREAAYALGAPKWKVILMVSLKAARAGVITGVLLALARISGETAPLLLTALSNQFWNIDMSEPMANLPVTIFRFSMSPFASWQQLAWVGIFILMIAVLVLNILARLGMKTKH
ncbi:MAG TPA: phosphate ABC transporter permease PtsA [Pasteurellaceae bacterium]|nr:phosphate ABC transporter permease PtsA [Pasteurellaceae bacterium]